MRDCFLTTQFGPQRAFQAGHKSLRSVQLCTVSLFCALPILYCRKLPKSMNRAWYPDELTQYWTLAPEERKLLGSNTPSATQLSAAVLLKSFQLEGRFPERRADVAGSVVVHLANQIGVPPEGYFDGDWSERTQRRQLPRIPDYPAFRPSLTRHESRLVARLRPLLT